MIARKWLILSTGANALLIGALLWRPASTPRAALATAATTGTSVSTNQAKTNLVVRRQNFTWHEVESNDYATYINNLREIGCPESTLRDIIVADVDQLYAHKRVSEVVSADHQWWKSEPDPDALQTAADKMDGLETERRALLTRLLGAYWEAAQNSAPPPEQPGLSLSGPVLGMLPRATKQSVYEITSRAQQAMDTYVQTQNGKPLDSQELARMRQQTRQELVQILTAPQMEEFLLRYSKTATELREELRGLNVSPDEFRGIFRARDPLDQQIDLSYAGSAAGTLKERNKALEQRETALKEVLGPERYATLKLSRDPVFLQTQERAQQLGMPPEAVLPVYEINQLSQKTATRIQSNANLTPDEKSAALQTVQAEQQKSLEKLLGPEWARRYQADSSAGVPVPPSPAAYTP